MRLTNFKNSQKSIKSTKNVKKMSKTYFIVTTWCTLNTFVARKASCRTCIKRKKMHLSPSPKG